jgi:SAM-dependent methyltransferase
VGLVTKRPANSINTARRLEQRIACNHSSTESFHLFVERLLAVRPDDCALELGAGLGAQFLPVAGTARRAVGVDVSADLLEALRARLTGDNAELVLGDMDELGTLGLLGPFTLAYSVYSIYYSRDPARVLQTLAGLLAGPEARCVVVVPDTGNNEAWYADLGVLYDLPEAVLACAGVGREVVLPALRALFPDVHCETLRSEVQFGALDELMSYYDACAPYCRPERREEARELFGRRFAQHGGYRITKRTLGIVGRLAG